MNRCTIEKEVQISGKGLHTGNEVTLRLSPAPESKGVTFIREDIDGLPRILADINNVISTNRSTCLGKSDIKINTVEHLLAAIASMGIDDIEVYINSSEVPILDGSAIHFISLLKEAGITEKESEKEPFVLTESLEYKDEETGAEYILLPSEKLEISVLLDFPNTSLQGQYAELKGMENFESEIANARTFVFADELLQLASEDLIKGGDLSNAIVVTKSSMTQEEAINIAEKLGKDPSVVQENGTISGQTMNYPNEPARHKILDLVGDLQLIGRPIQARIIARKPSHKSNSNLAKVLKKKYQEIKKLKGKPQYSPDQVPLYDLETIKSMLPHRYPFLLVDKILELSDTHVVGIKNVTFNENFFQGHFPGNPIFPGVLQMEALAQTGGILALSTVEEPSLWDTYFLKMDNVKFKHIVVPGDTLLLKMELLTPVRRGIVHMQGIAYVGNKIVSEGELTAQIIKRT